jgi:hypothetical protein
LHFKLLIIFWILFRWSLFLDLSIFIRNGYVVLALWHVLVHSAGLHVLFFIQREVYFVFLKGLFLFWLFLKGARVITYLDLINSFIESAINDESIFVFWVSYNLLDDISALLFEVYFTWASAYTFPRIYLDMDWKSVVIL